VIARPTTEQILLDCCRELATTVAPAVTDETALVHLQMLDAVLRNAAARAAHEIAWMLEETADMVAYATRAVAALEMSGAEGAAVGSAQQRLATAPSGWHLDDVVARYTAASALLAVTLEAALTAGDVDVVNAGEQLLARRVAREASAVTAAVAGR
jgi:hypothetical protein